MPKACAPPPLSAGGAFAPPPWSARKCTPSRGGTGSHLERRRRTGASVGHSDAVRRSHDRLDAFRCHPRRRCPCLQHRHRRQTARGQALRAKSRSNGPAPCASARPRCARNSRRLLLGTRGHCRAASCTWPGGMRPRLDHARTNRQCRSGRSSFPRSKPRRALPSSSAGPRQGPPDIDDSGTHSDRGSTGWPCPSRRAWSSGPAGNPGTEPCGS
mmetsp:Transcript_78432/g.177148  ORF Transcript_78432/g.177148 Transcript_78432/m.177148 type:complete len:214 (+) Transcript_78432:287-928(+)